MTKGPGSYSGNTSDLKSSDRGENRLRQDKSPPVTTVAELMSELLKTPIVCLSHFHLSTTYLSGAIFLTRPITISFLYVPILLPHPNEVNLKIK